MVDNYAPDAKRRFVIGGPGGGGRYDSRPGVNDLDLIESAPPRPLTDSTDPDTKKRNRRMFAGLLGTLHQFSKDAKKTSAMAAKRRAIIREADERTKAESRMIVLKARTEIEESREREEELRSKLDLKMIVKEIELVEEECAEHKERSKVSIRTRETPKIFYAPMKHTDATAAMQERGESEADEWRLARLAALGEAKKKMMEKHAAQKSAREVRQQALASSENVYEDMEQGIEQVMEEDERDRDASQGGSDGGLGRGGRQRFDENIVEENEDEDGELTPALAAALARHARARAEANAAELAAGVDPNDTLDDQMVNHPEGLEEMLGSH